MSSDASPKVALRTLDSDAFEAELDRAMDAETPLDPCWPTRSRPSLELSDRQSPGTPWMASLYALSLTMAGLAVVSHFPREEWNAWQEGTLWAALFYANGLISQFLLRSRWSDLPTMVAYLMAIELLLPSIGSDNEGGRALLRGTLLLQSVGLQVLSGWRGRGFKQVGQRRPSISLWIFACGCLAMAIRDPAGRRCFETAEHFGDLALPSLAAIVTGFSVIALNKDWKRFVWYGLATLVTFGLASWFQAGSLSWIDLVTLAFTCIASEAFRWGHVATLSTLSSPVTMGPKGPSPFSAEPT